MKILVFGANGMLGHQLCRKLQTIGEITATVRGTASLSKEAIAGVRLIAGVTAEDEVSVKRAIEQARPDFVLNCVGVVKQLDIAKAPVPSIRINSLFPHLLANFTADMGARLIHFSTDCVFSGLKGTPYAENDLADAQDLYGRSKLLGETKAPNALTLRTSIIGRELSRGTGLVEWLLRQAGRHIKGFDGAHYTGFTTIEICRIVSMIVTRAPELSGIWHVASDPITKHDLLALIDRLYGLGVTIERDKAFFCDRRLDGSRFREATGYVAPDWPSMIAEMREDDLKMGHAA